MKKYKGESVLLFATLIWGATFTIIKNALHDASPLIFISIRFSFAALVLLPFLFKEIKNINKPILLGGVFLPRKSCDVGRKAKSNIGRFFRLSECIKSTVTGMVHETFQIFDAS